MRPIFVSIALSAILLAVLVGVQEQAEGGGKSDSVVKATATATKPSPDGKQTVTITLAIESEWYLYANPVAARNTKEGKKEDNLDPEVLANNRTRISMKAEKPVQMTIDYPVGKIKQDGNGEYRVYQPTVSIPVQVQRTVGDTSPLKVVIDVNACHPGDRNGKGARCLLPGKVMLTVP